MAERRLCIFAFLLAATVASTFAGPAHAQDTAVPPAVTTNVERGVALARQSQWSLAIRYFRLAQEGAPDNPAVLLNLGLAFDRMGGREAIAGAWLRAYLAAAPGAGNARQVRERVAELESALEIRTQQMLEAVARIVDEVPAPAEKAALVANLVRGHAEFDDVAAARRAEMRMPAGPRSGWTGAHFAAALARRGDFAGAAAEARRLESPQMRSWALGEVAVEQAKTGSAAAALALIGDIRVPAEAAYAGSRVAVVRARAGDIEGATAALARIDEKQTAARAIGTAAVAQVTARAGDRAGAERLLDAAQGALARVEAPGDRLAVQALIAVGRATLSPELAPGDAVGGLPNGVYRDRALRDIAAIRGDMPRAEIHHWTSLAHEFDDNPILSDTAGSIEAAKGRPPKDSGSALAAVAVETARALARLRN